LETSGDRKRRVQARYAAGLRTNVRGIRVLVSLTVRVAAVEAEYTTSPFIPDVSVFGSVPF
jgi:hypothetical protein